MGTDVAAVVDKDDDVYNHADNLVCNHHDHSDDNDNLPSLGKHQRKERRLLREIVSCLPPWLHVVYRLIIRKEI